MPPSLICYCDFLKHLFKQSTLVFILTVLTVCVGLSTCMHRGGWSRGTRVRYRVVVPYGVTVVMPDLSKIVSHCCINERLVHELCTVK